ncbi:MAG: penicillin acylase family protein [Bacteroidetes bacterium]|nr:penicillin acylase family protein [Bacteroidota bacterium]
MKLKVIALTLLVACTMVAHTQVNPNYQVEIVRDSFGVPHIFGKTDADCSYGLVYSALEDDYKTVMWGLLLSRGKLGLMMGIEGAKIDYAVQLLGVPDFIEKNYEKDLSPETKKLLEAGAAAGNDWLKKHPEKIPFKSLMPIRPTDFISGYMLSMALMTGVDGVIKSVVGETMATIDYNKDARGSNALAMNSNITADGNVYLDCNAHQPLEGPMSWYEAHLHSDEGLNILGATFHGAVSIFHGTNENLGWAHTTNYFDAIDVYQLEMDPKKKNHYLVDGKSYKLETSSAKLSVNLSKKPLEKKFILTIGKKKWWSIYGATYKNKKGVFAIRLASNMTLKSVEEWYKMNKAKNFTEFRQALDIQGIINQYVTYADRFDTIYCVSNGAMPVRADGYDWKSTVPGNTEKTRWTQFLPNDSLPHVINPKCGYVFEVNNTSYTMTAKDENPKPLTCQKNISFAINETNRSMRFYEMMEAKKGRKLTWQDFLDIKYDAHYPRNVVAPFKSFDLEEVFHLDESKYPDISDAIQVMKAWAVERSGHISDTNATLVYKWIYGTYFSINDNIERKFIDSPGYKIQYFVEGVKRAKAEMLTDFGRLNVPLGEFQRHQRGDVDLPTTGAPDMWNAKYGDPYQKGKRRITAGESYILLSKFKKDGSLPELRSVICYGSSNTPGAKHYTDQMQLYVNQQTKEESLSKEWAYKHAERIYKPNE